MEQLPLQFQQLILDFSAVIRTAPSTASFMTVVVGWLLCNGRRTLSGIVRAAGPAATKSHDAYQNFFSKSEWSMDALWKLLFLSLVKVFPDGRHQPHAYSEKTIWIAGDDTLSKHYGRRIWGAGVYRDAVRSTKRHVAYAWGLNWVVLTMIVKLPLGRDRFIGFPIYARLNPKADGDRHPSTSNEENKPKAKGKGSQKKKTNVALMEEMVRTVAGWLPEAKFVFTGDGAYACLAAHMPANVCIVSRLRRDAALYEAPPKTRQKKRGRPAKKGKRLPAPQELANMPGTRWRTLTISLYGKTVKRKLYTFNALWYEACPNQMVNIVIVRDPNGKQDDEFFFTTDLEMPAEVIILCYEGRWAIEVVFRETKQYLGMNETQARKKEAVLRITPFCLWLNSLIKLWFIQQSRNGQPTLPKNDPWYTHKNTISFQDMISAIRFHFWRNYIISGSTNQQNPGDIRTFVLNSLAKVT